MTETVLPLISNAAPLLASASIVSLVTFSVEVLMNSSMATPGLGGAVEVVVEVAANDVVDEIGEVPTWIRVDGVDV